MATVVSSPGKVLIAGGYLVLDPVYSGVVVSTSSRFYTVVRDPASVTGTHTPNHIEVRSPQFLDATWTYSVNYDASGSKVSVEAAEGPSKNKFVHLAIQNTLALVVEIKGATALKERLSRGLHIVIVGDNDFYSQQDQLQARNLPPTLSSLAQLPPFSPTNVRLSDVAKTGLGSSAALITSFCTALLVHFSVIPPSVLATSSPSGASTEAKRLAHNLAQFVHCLAQGKVGSGFDVSAAVFGSHLYRRFSPEVIQPLMQDEKPPHLLAVLSPQNPTWDYAIQPFKLPPYTRILLADIHAGSNTPHLVSKVLSWRKEKKEEALALWTKLDQLNTSLAKCLTRLSELHERDQGIYLQAIKWIASIQSVQWLAILNAQPELSDCLEAFNEAHVLTEAIRAKMREMGSLSGVEIEPPQQTKLLDESISLAGVIGGGVPGAGGYDAVWLLLCDPPEPVHDIRPLVRVERLWGAQKSVTPLLAEESVAGSGIRLEEMGSVKGLEAVVSA